MTKERPLFGRRDPDARGYFGAYGGRFVPETLVGACQEVEREFRAAWADEGFRARLGRIMEPNAIIAPALDAAYELTNRGARLVEADRPRLPHVTEPQIVDLGRHAFEARQALWPGQGVEGGHQQSGPGSQCEPGA